MQIRNVVLSVLIVMPSLGFADDAVLFASPTDTFGKLLEKQAKLLDSEMDMRIRANNNQGGSVVAGGVNPLPGSKQEINDQEPIVEAIWGMEGKEVAEILYKGRRIPVSMQDPFISKVDGWKLESIQQYLIKMVKTDSTGHVVQRKSIMLDFLGGDVAAGRQAPSTVGPTEGNSVPPITPAITSPLVR